MAFDEAGMENAGRERAGLKRANGRLEALAGRSPEPDADGDAVPFALPVRMRDVLRAATDRDHRELDALVGEVWESRAAYVAYLAMNHLAHRVLEPVLETALDRFEALRPYHCVRGALLADLEALGERSGRGDGPAAPVACDLPAAIGLIYVLEGSRLGARMLHGRVASAPWRSVSSDLPMTFFEASRSTENFNGRMAHLEQLISGRTALDASVASARAAFALFRDAAERARQFQPARVDRKDAR
ncbi:biliverdin-producing heme oxygenase [Fulvimarina sp. 2208YS6-2-32]|uniref:Biliverdin-producing heme oxygenase n=1 Tax=Fulvimarina uroteuthidis TaxID=3098149 RepID=A0ABU5I0L9_9HYPH|nr:biliverdin-producing heme oxygenase [Fulvimarina sp. 2208YS6-2-32]MDY8108934.1 biliverdin-producing heme oxygenase [Fulvimarina sp. 2208YS6-2-32]